MGDGLKRAAAAARATRRQQVTAERVQMARWADMRAGLRLRKPGGAEATVAGVIGVASASMSVTTGAGHKRTTRTVTAQANGSVCLKWPDQTTTWVPAAEFDAAGWRVIG